MHFVKKIVLILMSSLLVLSSSLLTPAMAMAADPAPSTWYNQGFTDWYSKVYGDESPPSEIFGERYTAAQVQWILYSLFAFPINFLGSKVQGAVACLYAFGPGSVFDKTACIQQTLEAAGDAFQVLKITTSVGNNTTETKSFASAVFQGYNNRPVSGIKYLNDTFFRLNIIQTANAQGFGYTTAIDGLKEYWQGFRDIAYALSVLVVIIFAFMIMFRVKLSPQLVISVQSALPKIVGALILATFSYAIAGFVIDLSYVVGGLFASLMSLAGFAQSIQGQGPAQASAFQNAFNQIMPIQGTQAVGGFYILIWMFSYTIVFFFAAAWALISTISGLSVYGVLAGVLMVLLTIWLLILMLWYTLKVPWVLLKNLISLFVSIIVAPLQIVIGALVPTIGFGVWFKKIIAEALVFPLTGLFMFLALKTLMASFAASTGQFLHYEDGTLWTPPILGSSEDMAGIIWLSVSFVFITMIPKAVDIMKMLIMGAKFDFGSAIGEAAQPLTGALRLSSAIGNIGKEISTGWGFLNPKSDQEIGGASSQKKWWDPRKKS